MSQTIRVEFTRAEFDAVVAAMTEKAMEGHGDRSGPSVDRLDVLDALRRLEAADRYPRLVS